jgi:tRNA(Ile)-lysidine synthase
LAGLRSQLDLKLHVAHLNHGLRGAESDADAQYVSDLASRLGLSATIGQRDVAGYRLRHGLSMEEAAREVRYDFLAEAAASMDTHLVAVGHTADDQAETILMHLVRGAGTRGLRGMQPVGAWKSAPGHTQLTVVRPLLEVSREQTEAYCRAHELQPRSDSSNLWPAYLRNRLRFEALPVLQAFNPRLRDTLLRTGRIMADELAFLEERVAQVWDNVVNKEGDLLALDSEKLAALHPALQRHLLRATVEHFQGSLKDIEADHVEQMMAALAKPAGKRLALPGGLVFWIDYGRFLIGYAALCPLPPLQGEHRLKVPGETLLPGWKVRASIEPSSSQAGHGGRFAARLDFEVAGSDLVVRGRRQSDRFQPLGMGLTKKLQDFMVGAKIPGIWRNRVPLVFSPRHIIWVVGWRIDDRAKITTATKQVLQLSFERPED